MIEASVQLGYEISNMLNMEAFCDMGVYWASLQQSNWLAYKKAFAKHITIFPIAKNIYQTLTFF